MRRDESPLTAALNPGDFNWLDWAVVVVVVLSALEGTRRGLLLGTLALGAAAVGLAVAFIFERPIGDAVVGWFPSIAPALAHLGAFVVLLIGAQVLISATVGRAVLFVARALARGPLGGLDR